MRTGSRFTFWIKSAAGACCWPWLSASHWAPRDASSRFTRPGPSADVHLRLRADAGRVQPRGLPGVAAGSERAERGHRRGHERQGDPGQFAAKYGATVLAAPTTQGFDLVAWIAPFAVFAAALLGTILLVRRWSVGKRRPPPHSRRRPCRPTRCARKIRRETDAGNDGGF